ncbi:MAG TPA: amidase [Thermodesulfobacteriota bacterium]
MADRPDDLAWLPIHRLAPRIAAREIRPPELVEACLARIAALDPHLGAFAEVYRDEARLAADEADRLIRAGRYLGSLHGIPVALKDLIEIEGRRTTCGSLLLQDRRSSITATVVTRLRAAGAIVLGKTGMVEFAYGGWGTNASLGTPRNPWDPSIHRVPGGSSSGSGVAVAAGMVTAAIGSDTGGSIRIPASLCGIVGLKPTAGRVSLYGVVPLSRTLDSIGPMTRSVEDAALLLEVMAGPDAEDPLTAAAPAADVSPVLGAGVRGMRLALLPPRDRDGVDPDVLLAFDEAVAELVRAGAQVEPLALTEPLGDYAARAGIVMAPEAYAAHRDLVEREGARMDPHVRARFLAGARVGAADYLDALDHRRGSARAFIGALAGFDAFLTPTTPIVAIPVTEVDEGALPLSRFTRAVNYLGLCALALPCGFDRQGLPVSLQIVGRPFDEATVLRVGLAFERATRWHERRPPPAPIDQPVGGVGE